MSLKPRTRRLVKSASSVLLQSTALPRVLLPSPTLQPVTLPQSQRRHGWFSRKPKPSDDLDPSKPANRQLLDQLRGGKIESNSIFEDEISSSSAATSSTPGVSTNTSTTIPGLSMVREHLARAIDPDPRSRLRWDRKMTIRLVGTATDPFSREPRIARIKRTERELTVRSPKLPTSVKKLVHLARQIAGKPVDDALVQMRYSKKKMAKEVKHHLELARDRAVAERGMGLGLGTEGIKEVGKKEVKFQTKDGKWLTVEDPTRMYVAQAWVGRSTPRGMRAFHRARGRVDTMVRPATTISIVLKEEKTRIREYKEREQKKYRQGPWVHLPDRPITAQRQYYTW